MEFCGCRRIQEWKKVGGVRSVVLRCASTHSCLFSFLGSVDLVGTTYEDKIMASGYGTYIAVPLLRREYREVRMAIVIFFVNRLLFVGRI